VKLEEREGVSGDLLQFKSIGNWNIVEVEGLVHGEVVVECYHGNRHAWSDCSSQMLDEIHQLLSVVGR